MKKLKFNLLSLLVLFVTATIFIACSSDEQVTEHLQENTSLVAPEYGKDITLSNVSIKGARKIGAGFAATLGRKSKDCFGFGVCELVAIWVIIEGNKKVVNSGYDIHAIGEDNYAILKLDNELDSTVYDSNLYIDEDLLNENGTVFMNTGTYVIDYSIGEYGGYMIPVSY